MASEFMCFLECGLLSLERRTMEGIAISTYNYSLVLVRQSTSWFDRNATESTVRKRIVCATCTRSTERDEAQRDVLRSNCLIPSGQQSRHDLFGSQFAT